mgnify:FL=1
MLDKNKRYLITGAAGFLGVALLDRLESLGVTNVVTVSRNEGKLIEIAQKYPWLEIIPGDISNIHCLQKGLKDIDGVFHLAAFKHVGLAETHCRECTASNVVGTMNLLDLTRDMELDFIIGISTDKAAQVSGIYGASKLLMEGLFSEYEQINPDTKYRIVRYGNVLYSTGSVLCKWKDLLSNNEEVIVTDAEATRFFWTREQAIDLIFDCLHNANDSTPYCPDMKSMKIADLLEAMSNNYLPEGGELKVKTIGIQKGENLHEKILEEGPYSNEVELYTVEEIESMV